MTALASGPQSSFMRKKPMPSQAPDRIVELWPLLPEAARKTLVDIAEASAPRDGELALSRNDQKAIVQSIADIAEGRTLDEAAYRSEMDAFMARLTSSNQG